MSIVLYDDFEDGTFDKWDISSNDPANTATIVSGDAIMPTNHAHLQSGRYTPSTGGLVMALSKGDAGEGKYIKALVQWQDVISGTGILVINSDASFLNGYMAFIDFTSRIFKMQGGVFTQLINPSNAWAQNTNFTAEFFQEPDGNLVLKRDGIIVSQVINNDITGGSKVGIRTANGVNFYVDDVFVESGVVISNRKLGRGLNKGLGRGL
ncbi:MAG: hypothetical protein KAV87_63335 [Desulfobacteraceae bacterium]|nr:hypothetical protein [Desulfobacteraceae bacterium]